MILWCDKVKSDNDECYKFYVTSYKSWLRDATYIKVRSYNGGWPLVNLKNGRNGGWRLIDFLWRRVSFQIYWPYQSVQCVAVIWQLLITSMNVVGTSSDQRICCACGVCLWSLHSMESIHTSTRFENIKTKFKLEKKKWRILARCTLFSLSVAISYQL